MKKSFNEMKDYEVVERWQKGNHLTQKRIEEYLYIKYRPLIMKYSSKYSYVSSYEDNMQEAYLIMIKALEYINTDKIYNKELYSFGVTFKEYITGYFHANYKNALKKHFPVQPLYETHSEEEASFDIKDIRGHVENELAYLECCQEYIEFRNSLEGNEKKIMILMEKGLGCKEIMKKMKFKSMANVTYYTKLLKKKYVVAMNKRGYELQYA